MTSRVLGDEDDSKAKNGSDLEIMAEVVSG
jgi:hypothetical protein